MASERELVEELRLKNSLLAAQNDASITGLLVVDDNGRIISYNRRFVEMWELAPEVLATGSDAKAIESVLAKLIDPEGFMKGVNHLYRNRDEKTHDELLLRDGRVFERYSAPVRGDDGRYYGRLWHFRDNTELLKVEALRAEIKQGRELATLKDEFIGTVSHELRTPLTSVMTAVDALRKGLAGALSPKQQCVADLCHRNILRLNKMINNLLDISRLEAGTAKVRMERVDLNALVADFEANFRLMGRGKVVRITVDAFRSLPDVRADSEMISQVLDILLDNAERFATSSVRVTLRPEVGPFEGREVGGVRVEVADDGPGIPADRVELLFNKFTQVARAAGGGYKGTGLGLAICKEMLSLHGTTIEVQTAQSGARFHFFLPEWNERFAPGERAGGRKGVASDG